MVLAGGKALPAIVPQALGSLRRHGRVVVVGYQKGVSITVDSHVLVNNAFEIRGSRSSTMTDLFDAVEMVESGVVKPIVSVTMDLTQANEALDLMRTAPPLGRLVLTS
jgi:D-arabinose 1-dehydrogenase-like Zn-dependent alcohol dehydrogenase